MKKKLFLFVALLCCTSRIFAYDALIDGIYYNLDTTNMTAEVTKSEHINYAGSITIPASIIYNQQNYSVTRIGDKAFYECNGLTSITIPNTITTIGFCAFYKCIRLTSIAIPNSVTTIERSAFENCSSLTSVIIPNSVTMIEKYAFSYCEGLTALTIPNSLTTIGLEVFFCCKSLTSVTIPNSVTEIGYRAFAYCSGLTSITIPNSITTIGGRAFSNCSSLTSVTIPDSVTTIKIGTFENCNSLTSITIPNSVTKIEEEAFSYCSSMTSLTIGNSVTTIGDNAFNFCNSLTKTNYTGTIADWCKIKFGNDMSNAHANPMCYSHNFFINDVEVKDLVIPQGVKTIGEYAFCGCSSLTSVTFSYSVDKIAINAFEGCNGLTSITIDSNTLCSQNCYWLDTRAVDLIIGNSVTSIGIGAFSNCTGLTSVTIPNSVTAIGYMAFSGCKGLTKTNYTGTIAEWCKIKFGKYFGENYANPMYYSHNFFINDVEVKDLVIPQGIDSIGDFAFHGCSGLTSVTIPASVTGIGEKALSECTGLTQITSEAATPPVCRMNCFNLVDKTIPLYVPAESIELYKAADEWKEFNNIKAIGTSELPKIRNDKNVKKYIENGQVIFEKNGKRYNALGQEIQ